MMAWMMATNAFSTLCDGLEAQKELHQQQGIQGPMSFAVHVQVTRDHITFAYIELSLF